MAEEPNDTQKIMDVLDANQPNWFIYFADPRDLADYAFETFRNLILSGASLTSIKGFEREVRRLKKRTAERLIHVIVNSALQAGVVNLADQSSDSTAKS
jgi:hypothetical protein